MHLNGPIYFAKVDLTPEIPLHVFLVKGANYAVWIDSGIKPMFGQFCEVMQEANVSDHDLRFILHTHSHHDHIGCNAQLKDKTDCLIAAPGYYAKWHADFEEHLRGFARPFPELIPDSPEVREEVFGPMDAPRPLDLHTQEGDVFDLGGGVTLRAYSFPGHLMAELGWFEASTRTLILGDAITGLDWPLIQGHVTVKGYRDSVEKIRRLIGTLNVRQVVFAHFPPMSPEEAEFLLDRAHVYIDSIEVFLLRRLAAESTATLESLWKALCSGMNKRLEFRALGTVDAHLKDLMERGIVREIGYQSYALK